MKQSSDKKTRIIGVMGGIGSGKSELLKYLEMEYHAYIIIADRVAEMFMQPGTECMNSLKKEFPEHLFSEDGNIIKSQLADYIFQNPEEREHINRLVHPVVVRWIQEEILKYPKGSIVMIESALLLEAKINEFCDEVWYVYAKKEVRSKRLLASRGYSIEKIQTIMNVQRSEEEFLEFADVVIDNNDGICKMKEQVDALLLVRER